MFDILGYNFCFDINAIDPTPTNIDNITSTKVENGIFDHFNITRDVSKPYSSSIPNWDFFTILDANFNGSINAGNVDFVVSQISSIKVKRRIKGTFDWITYVNLPISVASDLQFNMKDLFNANDIEYEYALVPMIGDVEGNYIMNDIKSQFNGVFICDYESIFKFYTGVEYGTTESVQSVGTYETIGGKYPIIVSNSAIDYNKGSVKATILNPDYEQTRKIDRQAIVNYQNLITKFLKNKRAKILKDWNGNIWLVYLTSNPNINYVNEYGMGIVDTTFEWVEQGDANSQQDLYRNGLVEVLE